MRNLPFLNVSSKRDRMIVAIITGVISGIVIGFLYAYLQVALNINFEFSIIYILLGYLVGAAIKYTSKGVTNEIRVIGAISAIICFLSADMFFILIKYGMNLGFALRFTIETYSYTFKSILSLNDVMNSVLFVAFRLFCVVAAYQNSTVSYER